ncbi:MAG: hypothetical protein AAF617_00610 [Bacteroidota bacterium]
MTKSSKTHSIQSVVLLLIFTLLKLGIAHELSHAFSDHDEVADCEDCFLMFDTTKKHSFDLQFETYETLQDVTLAAYKPILLLYKNPLVYFQFTTEFHNKPPPNLV